MHGAQRRRLFEINASRNDRVVGDSRRVDLVCETTTSGAARRSHIVYIRSLSLTPPSLSLSLRSELLSSYSRSRAIRRDGNCRRTLHGGDGNLKFSCVNSLGFSGALRAKGRRARSFRGYGAYTLAPARATNAFLVRVRLRSCTRTDGAREPSLHRRAYASVGEHGSLRIH